MRGSDPQMATTSFSELGNPNELLEAERSRLYVESHPEIRAGAPGWAEEIDAGYFNEHQPWSISYLRHLEGGVTLVQSAFHHPDGRLEFDPWVVELEDDTIHDTDELRAVMDGLRAAGALIRREDRATR